MHIPAIDQARQTFLALSLVQLATRRHSLSLEMTAIRRMRRELAVKIRGKRQRWQLFAASTSDADAEPSETSKENLHLRNSETNDIGICGTA